MRCRECGFGWTFPPLPVDRIAFYYPPTYLGDVTKSLEAYLSGKLLKSRCWRGETEKGRLVERFVRGGRILDIGCGAGQFLWALDSSRWEKTGVELSRNTVELVLHKLPSLQLVAGDIYSSELPEGNFDVITFWHALEHLPDPEKVIDRAAALLRPNGWLIVSLPNLASFQARFFRKYWYPFDDVPRHLYHFSRRALDLLLDRAGLLVRDHLPFSPLVNFHSLKHSLFHWSEDRLHSRVPYYALKPLLFLLPPLERLRGSYGILTTIAQKNTL
jgi:SAM-dependent methyltransferase